eukprot:4055846-Amphidinium_carterae.1
MVFTRSYLELTCCGSGLWFDGSAAWLLSSWLQTTRACVKDGDGVNVGKDYGGLEFVYPYGATLNVPLCIGVMIHTWWSPATQTCTSDVYQVRGLPWVRAQHPKGMNPYEEAKSPQDSVHVLG